jgi:glucosylceramidase
MNRFSFLSSGVAGVLLIAACSAPDSGDGANPPASTTAVTPVQPGVSPTSTTTTPGSVTPVPGTPPVTPGTPPVTPPVTPGTPPVTPPVTPGTPPVTPGTPPVTPGTPPVTPGTEPEPSVSVDVSSGVPDDSTGGEVTSEEPLPPAPQVVTSSDGALWMTGTYTTGAAGNADVTVSDSGNQPWLGFGGTFNEAGWDALGVLTEAQREEALELLYGAADGANFTYGRLPIGASDYAMDEYSLNDTAGDNAMANFSIARDEEKLIPFVKAAQAVKSDIQFWSSPWTPPAWMKTNNSFHSAAGQKPPFDDADGMMKGDDATLTAFALYLEKYVQAYAGKGIDVSAIHPQNEPGYGNPYPSCYWNSDVYIKFIRDYLGPKFAQSLPDVEIWAGTMSAPEDGTIATNLANDAAALGFVTGFGLQWNTKDKVATLRGKGKLVMQTEHKCGNYNFGTDYWEQSRYDGAKPQNDYAYGVESWKNIRDWVKAGVNSYSAWNMVLDTLGTNLNKTTPWHQNALLVVDRGAKTLTKTPAYYVFRHLSQYVEEGSTVVGVTGGDALAFKKDDRYVVVMYNEGAAKQAVVAVGGEKLQVSLPNNGWATVVYPN